LLYDDFRDDKPVVLRTREIVTPDLQPMTYTTKPLFNSELNPRQMPRIKSYLQSIGADTVIIPSPPSDKDYADINSGNGVTVTYYATGISSKGKEFRNEQLDVANILNSRDGVLKDTILFDNGEGRIIIDLKRIISVGELNFYFDQFRNRGSQIFTIWASSKGSSVNGDPLNGGWQYVGPYGITGRGLSSYGTSMEFKDGLKCRYLMLVTDGSWHGTEYIKQLDICEKK
jgi:hypothetical protein